ncbi:MAG: tol-pal system protein YbgF [Deltaproteobacteria bacterium]|nr:MAG: tol-pal system protein YbgF [Deltaproteobacteria bacterium]
MKMSQRKLDNKSLWYLCLSIIIFFVIALSSCVYDEQFTYINDRILSLNKRVDKLEKEIDTKLERDLDARLSGIRSNQAQLRVDIDRLQDEVRALSGRVENNEHVIKGAVERDLSEQDAMRASVRELTKKVAKLETIVKQQQDYLGLETLAKPGEGSVVRGPVKLPSEGQAQVPPAKEKKSEEEILYNKSLAFFQEGRFEDAMNGFKTFLERYPNSDLADNAQFWIGESYMAMKNYEKAILAYQEVIKKYPNGNKVPNALLRQAEAFLKINDKISSKLLLRKIIKKYPNSNEAKIAQRRLSTLK